MADPLSVAASILALVAAGYKISKGLNDIAETWKNAPQELFYIKMSMDHMITCLSSAMALIEDHSHLYANGIVSMLADIAWQFKLLQDFIMGSLKGGKGGKIMLRFRWLLEQKKIGGFMSKLEALKSSTGLILQVAQLAEKQASTSLFKNHQIGELREHAINTITHTKAQVHRLEIQSHQPLLIEDSQYRELVKYEERPIDMANWMAVTLSAPPLGRAVSKTSRNYPQEIQRLREGPQLLPVKKPTWLEGSSRSSYVFKADEVDTDVLEKYGMKLQLRSPREVKGRSVGTIEVTKSGDPQPFESYELEMIATMSAVSRSIPKHGWTIQNSPFIRQEPKMILDQLLMKWTTLGDSQVRDILVGGFEDTKEPYGGVTLAFDIDSDTGSEREENEDGGTNLEDGDDSQTETYGSPNKPPTPPKNNLERPWADRKGHISWEDEMRSYGKNRRQGLPGKSPGPFAPKPERHKKPPYGQDDQATHLNDGFTGNGSRSHPYIGPSAPLEEERERDRVRRAEDAAYERFMRDRPRERAYHPEIPGDSAAGTYDSKDPLQNNQPADRSHFPANRQYAGPQNHPQNHHWGGYVPWHYAQPYNPYHGYPIPYAAGYSNYYAHQQPFYYPNHQPQQHQQANDEVADLRRKFEELQVAMASQAAAHERKRADSPRDAWLEMEREWEGRKQQEALKERLTRAEAMEMQQKTLRQQEEERKRVREELLREREREEEDKRVMLMKLEAEIRAKIRAETQQQESERRQFHLELEHEKAMERLWKLRHTENAPKVESWEITTEPDHGLHQETTQQARLQEHQARLIGEVQALAESLRRQQAELQGDIRRLHVATAAPGPDSVAHEVKEDLQMQKTKVTQLLPGALAYQIFDDSEGEQWDGQEGEEEEEEVSSDDSQSEISESDDISAVDSHEESGQLKHARLRIPCSQPWKGPAGILPFTFSNIPAHILPVYIRGNDEGQTWYHGEDMIFVNELAKSYSIQCGEGCNCDKMGGGDHITHPAGSEHTSGQSQYLQISKQWVGIEALEQLGMTYTESDQGNVYLDPNLTWADIAALCDLTGLLRGTKPLQEKITTPTKTTTQIEGSTKVARLAKESQILPVVTNFSEISLAKTITASSTCVEDEEEAVC